MKNAVVRRGPARDLLYTDGVVEVENSLGEFFGDSKLDDVVRTIVMFERLSLRSPYNEGML